MKLSPRPASEVYPSSADRVVEDEPVSEHYKTWDYSIAYVKSKNGEAVPEGGNTAIFRIAPRGMTEPVYVTKKETDATFTVDVKRGRGLLYRLTSDKNVEAVYMSEGNQIVIKPGEAYIYKNLGSNEGDDLILEDTAYPAFVAGDDTDLTSSKVVWDGDNLAPKPADGTHYYETPEGETRSVEIPFEFWDAALQHAMKDVR